ncbi:MAG: hypothetical protein IT462_14470 [Planctomycetes bacterium]|nr:hypothetical protein [Planctomycetota bacterium]
MLLNQSNLKVHCAASQRGRYALNSVAVTPRGTLSTDGQVVLLVPLPNVRVQDAPTIEGVNAASPAPKMFLLRTEDAARAAGMLGKGKRGWSSPWTETVQAEVKDGKMLLAATDLSSPQTMVVSEAEGQFPDVGSVLPDFSKAQTISLNINLALKAFKALRGATKEAEVTLRIIDDQHGIGLSCRDGVCMYVMPMNVETADDHCPDKLALLKEPLPEAVKALAGAAAVVELGSATPAAEKPVLAPGEADTSVGSTEDLADLPDEDSDEESDDYAYGDAYQDDGPVVDESEMSDAAEVLAKAEAAQNEAGALGNIAAKLETTPAVPATVEGPALDVSPAPVTAPVAPVTPEVVTVPALEASSAPVAAAVPATPVAAAVPAVPLEVPAEAVAAGV